MNNVRSIAALNEYELKLALDGSTSGSWHDEYKDSAVVFIGGLDPGLTEGDVITIFSQFGEILDINLPKWTSSSIATQQRRNNATLDGKPGGGGDDAKQRREAEEARKRIGKRRGFGFLLYQDQRSTVLAVDNLNGAQILNKTLRVDHVKDYKQLEKDAETGKMKEAEERTMNARPQLEGGEGAGGAGATEETDADDLDLEDPMAAYIAKNSKKSNNDDDDLDWLLKGDFGQASTSMSAPGTSRRQNDERDRDRDNSDDEPRRRRRRDERRDIDDEQRRGSRRHDGHRSRTDDDKEDDYRRSEARHHRSERGQGWSRDGRAEASGDRDDYGRHRDSRDRPRDRYQARTSEQRERDVYRDRRSRQRSPLR